MKSALPVVVGLLVCGSFRSAPAQKGPGNQTTKARAIAPSYQAQLKGAVRTATGTPWGGRDARGNHLTNEGRRFHQNLLKGVLQRTRKQGGLVLTKDGGLIPGGYLKEKTALRTRPWSQLEKTSHETLDTTRMLGLLAATGTPTSVNQKALSQLGLGLPSFGSSSAASKGRENKNREGKLLDVLHVRSDKVFSYNVEKNLINWVSWTVHPTDLRVEQPKKGEPGPTLGTTSSGRRQQEGVSRLNDMRADHSLRRGWYRPAPIDYLGSGFDPGHMVPSAERTGNQRDQQRTNVYSNMVPQASSNNRGPWVAFESMIQNYARKGWTVHVVAGGGFGKKAHTIGHGVAVPDTTWKVALFVPPNGSAAKDGKVYAINVPNRNTQVSPDAAFTQYALTPKALEGLTGFRFFNNFSAPQASAFRSRLNTELVKGQKTVSSFAKTTKREIHKQRERERVLELKRSRKRSSK